MHNSPGLWAWAHLDNEIGLPLVKVIEVLKDNASGKLFPCGHSRTAPLSAQRA